MRIISLFLLLSFIITVKGYAQPINAYAKVTAISGAYLTLSNINQTYHTFAVGDEVIIMQMQDNVLGESGNNTNFGTIGNIGAAGLYEVKRIQSFSGTTMRLTSAPMHNYNTGANASVQIISYRLYNTNNHVINSDIIALNWDGNIGGVIAFQVPGRIRLNANISANGAGFRGGSSSALNNTTGCDQTFISNVSTISGSKGEGIFRRTDANHQYGRAKIINGGGGGNLHNSGGGGGGNISQGGNGGAGYDCSVNPAGGQGGLALSPHSTIQRAFMGGGGGGGHQNNTAASDGGNGGGIIFIEATEILTQGNCGTRLITANGANAANAANDGAGGGGGGGTIVMDVPQYGFTNMCTVSLAANGGNGGSSIVATSHGGGGAGGQGRIILSAPKPTNLEATTNNGQPGCDNNSNPCNSFAGTAGGTNGTGINFNAGNTPLPVRLLYFEGAYSEVSKKSTLHWATATERNNSFFTIERAGQDLIFSELVSIQGEGTSERNNHYQHEDTAPLVGMNYYRLWQTDHDGTKEYLGLIKTHRETDGSGVNLYPNPVKENEQITIDLHDVSVGQYTICLINAKGVKVGIHRTNKTTTFHSIQLPTHDLPAGLYMLQIFTHDNQHLLSEKLIIQ